MRAVGQQRRSAAAPPSHPSGATIDGGGTWGEGRPELNLGQFQGKRGYQTPSISAFAGITGEMPSSPVSIPDKRGGSPPTQGAAAVERSEAVTRASTPPDAPGRDPCTTSPTKTPDGAKPGSASSSRPAPQHEIVCRKGEVHSAVRGRDARQGAAPDGAFDLGATSRQSPPQGPAGAAARAPEKMTGYGTAHVAVGSCAPEGPSMTVKTPPAHPALAAPAPRSRQSPAVPAFGVRAALPASRSADGDTVAPRGLSVSQAHLSGPLARPGPRVPRADRLASAPPGSLASDPAPASRQTPAAPSGADATGKAPFTPTAAQAAASIRGGGGSGGLTDPQQHATNSLRMDVIRVVTRGLESELPTYRERAEQSQDRLRQLDQAESGRRQAYAEQFEAEQQRKRAATAEERHALDDAVGRAKARVAHAEAEYRAAVEKHGSHEEARKDARKKQAEYERKRERKTELEHEYQTLNAKNWKLRDRMGFVDEAREEKERERLKRVRDREAHIEEKLEDARAARQKRNASRAGYRATQRAKARRAGNKLRNNLAKARKLLATAMSPNQDLGKKARGDALAKAKKAAQTAADAARAKLDAIWQAAMADGELSPDETREIAAAETDIIEAEALRTAIDNAGEPPTPPPADPCKLPCECNIKNCDPPDLCKCSRKPAEPGGEPLPPGGDPVPPEGGRGGAGATAPPEPKVPPVGSGGEAEGDGGSAPRSPLGAGAGRQPSGRTGAPIDQPPPGGPKDGKPTGDARPASSAGGRSSVVTAGRAPGSRSVAPPGTTTTPRQGWPSYVAFESSEKPPLYCSSCAVALEWVAIKTDMEAAECLWAALGDRWKGGDWESPSDAAFDLGWRSGRAGAGWKMLRDLLTEQCHAVEPGLDPEHVLAGAQAAPDPDDELLEVLVEFLKELAKKNPDLDKLLRLAEEIWRRNAEEDLGLYEAALASFVQGVWEDVRDIARRLGAVARAVVVTPLTEWILKGLGFDLDAELDRIGEAMGRETNGDTGLFKRLVRDALEGLNDPVGAYRKSAELTAEEWEAIPGQISSLVADAAGGDTRALKILIVTVLLIVALRGRSIKQWLSRTRTRLGVPRPTVARPNVPRKGGGGGVRKGSAPAPRSTARPPAADPVPEGRSKAPPGTRGGGRGGTDGGGRRTGNGQSDGAGDRGAGDQVDQAEGKAEGKRSGGPDPHKIGPRPFPDEYPNVLKAMKDRNARDALRPEVRKAYADWYENDVAPNTNPKSKNFDLARRFNLYRAKYFRGEVDHPPGDIDDLGWRKYVPE